MASPGPWEEMSKTLGESQTRLREALASGNVPVDQELEARIALANVLHQKFQAQRVPSDLYDSIQHLETIVRRLARPSTQRAIHLNQLSYQKMSAFGLTNARRDLDESIAYATQAKSETDFNGNHLLSKIHHNLGYGLSHRAQIYGVTSDLDESITCGLQVLRLAENSSMEYRTTVTNLALRFHIRYRRDHKTSDSEQATSLVNQQLRTYPAGTPEHGAALVVKGEIAYDKFLHTRNVGDLDEALAHAKHGLASMGENHEKLADILSNIITLHEYRYEITKDASEMKHALGYSALRLQSVPIGHPTRANALAKHLYVLQESLSVNQTLPKIQEAIKQAMPLWDEIAKDTGEKHSGGVSVGALFARRYILSQGVHDLKALMVHSRDICSTFNSSRDKMQPAVDSSPLWDLCSSIFKLSNASPDNPVRVQALDKFYQYFCTAYKPKLLLQGLFSLHRKHAEEIKILVKNLDSANALSSKDIAAEKEKLKKELESRNKPSSGHLKQPDDYHDMFTGVRHLAMDPDSKRIVTSMEGVVRESLGYTGEEPRTLSEFLERETRLELEFFEREKKEGKNPNPDLCRVCRIVKPLIPLDTGEFRWNSRTYLPFGNWNQLRGRRHCSICKMITSLISIGNGEELHPRLARIDQEIQGVQFHIEKLPTGEHMLGVEYGLKTVGSLRILTPTNHSDALRQGWKSSPTATGKEQIPEAGGSNLHCGQIVNWGKLKNWVNDCDHNHGQLCNSYLSDTRCAKDIPLVLIDVHSRCLVQATSAEKYYTLSYVWGKIDMPRTLLLNFQERLKDDSLSERSCKLPHTVRDAMELVSCVGGQYLWVDSLCIVQDDEENKHRDIHRMDIVYGKAFATIAAMSGDDADAGLSGQQWENRPSQKTESIFVSNKSPELAYIEGASATTEKVTLVSTPASFDFVLESSAWNSRGWILQERLLSRRCFYFSRDYVYFQCNQRTLCETTLEGPAEIFGHSLPNTPQKGNPLSNLKETTYMSRDERRRQVLANYKKLVEMYTVRELSYGADILNAFLGILLVVTEYFESSFISGLPAAALDISLLWTSTETLKRRRPSNTAVASNDFAGVAPEESFPSWSWAGWVGPVEYRLVPFEGEPLPTPSISIFYTHHHGCMHEIQTQLLPSKNGSNASAEFETKQINISGPDLGPNILQFWANTLPNTSFRPVTHQPPDYLSTKSHIHTRGKQLILRLFDKNNHHCGLQFGTRLDNPHSFALRKLFAELRDRPREYVEISRVGSVWERRKGPSRVEGEIPFFDERQYQSVGKGSGLVCALVVEWDQDVAERYSVAIVHERAWDKAGPRRKHVRLG